MNIDNRVAQRIMFNKLNTVNLTKKSIEYNQKIEQLKNIWEELSKVKWLWPSAIKTLSENWITTTEQLKQMTDEWIENKFQSPIIRYNIKEFIRKHNEKWQDLEQYQAID
jgi:hypothetical protein